MSCAVAHSDIHMCQDERAVVKRVCTTYPAFKEQTPAGGVMDGFPIPFNQLLATKRADGCLQIERKL